MTNWRTRLQEFLEEQCGTAGFEQKLENLIESIIQEQKDKAKKDLLKIADQGEYEDLRREVEIYFKQP